jgi:hypothetical protein
MDALHNVLSSSQVLMIFTTMRKIRLSGQMARLVLVLLQKERMVHLTYLRVIVVEVGQIINHVESPTTIVDCPECGYLGKEKESRDEFDLDYESDEID